MTGADKPRPRLLPFVALVCCGALVGGGCNRMITPRTTQLTKDADARARDGDYLQAINLYERALDGSTESADVHYKLALLYDDKMNDPLHALHHFKRYLTLSPTGRRADEVKNFMKRDELALVTSMSGDAVVSRGEAARLKNENLNLRKELEERAAQTRAATASEKAARASTKEKAAGARSHVVEPGDTLYSLARQYYGSPKRWRDIRKANSKSVDSSGKLKVGQTITIP